MEELRSCCAFVNVASAAETTSTAVACKEGEGIVCQLARQSAVDQEEETVISKGSASEGKATHVEGYAGGDQEIRALFVSRAWSLSISPAKNIGPSVLMIYMMGGGIFGLMFLGFAMLNTVKALLAVNKVFDDFERAAKVKGNTLLQRIAYVAICLGFSAFFAYRAISSGTLPLGPSALQTINPRYSPEAASIKLAGI